MRRLLLPLLSLLLLLLVSGPAVQAEEGQPAAKPRAVIKTSMGDITVELWREVAPRTVANFLGLADGKGTFADLREEGKTVTIRKPFYDGLGFHRVIKNFMLQAGCPKGDGTGDAGYFFADEINAKALGLGKAKVMEGGRPHRNLGIRSPQDFQRNVLLPLFQDMGIDLNDFEAQKAREAEVKTRVAALTLLDLYTMQGYRYDETLPSKPPLKGCLAMANAGPNTNGSQFFINLIDTPWLTGKHTVFGRVVSGMDVVEKIGAVKVGAGAKPVEAVKILSIRSIP